MKREKNIRERLWEEATGHCIYCGKPVSREEMEADHIVPLCLGGDNNYENKVCSCPRCNARKAGQSLEEFLRDNMGKIKRKRFSNRINHLAEQGKMSWEKAERLDPYTEDSFDEDWDEDWDDVWDEEPNGLPSNGIRISGEIFLEFL